MSKKSKFSVYRVYMAWEPPNQRAESWWQPDDIAPISVWARNTKEACRVMAEQCTGYVLFAEYSDYENDQLYCALPSQEQDIDVLDPEEHGLTVREVYQLNYGKKAQCLL